MPAAERPVSDDELLDLFAPAARVSHAALAVSGGSDSAALMLLAARWARLLSAPPRLSVLTLDHGLRPEAAAEASQVALGAAADGLGHRVLSWTGAKPASGLQAAARAARYALLTGWCRDNAAAVLMTAHTLDDQAETVIMRLARGSGLEGLAGIFPEVEQGGVAILRPLLGQTRARLRAALIAAGRSWIDDPSNGDARFERVRIREGLPQLAALGLTPEALARTAGRALEAWRALAGQAEDFLRASVRHHDEGYGEVDLERFAALAPELRARVLARLVQRYGGARSAPPALSGLERLADLQGWGQPARTFGGCKLARRRKTLLVGRESGRIDPAPRPVPASGGILWDGRFLVAAPPGNRVVPAGILSQARRVPELPAFVREGLPAVLDGDGRGVVPHLEPAPGVSVAFADALSRRLQ